MDESNAQQPKKTYSPEEVAAMYHRNPSPKRRYDITMKVENAPGPFESYGASAHYDAPDCVYTMDRFAGVHGRVFTHFKIDFKKIDATTFVGTMYLDAMQDEDYFGKGVCKWEFSNVGVGVSAGEGDDYITNFGISMDREDVIAQKTIKRYYAKTDYPKSDIRNYSDSGLKDKTEFKPEYRDDVFSITITATEIK